MIGCDEVCRLKEICPSIRCEIPRCSECRSELSRHRVGALDKGPPRIRYDDCGVPGIPLLAFEPKLWKQKQRANVLVTFLRTAIAGTALGTLLQRFCSRIHRLEAFRVALAVGLHLQRCRHLPCADWWIYEQDDVVSIARLIHNRLCGNNVV